MNKTLLITGASGFVGRHLKDYMMQKGYSVLTLDIAGDAEIKGDITDSSFIFEKLAKEDFDCIIHLAALTNIRQTTENPYLTYRVNSFGTLNLLELASRKNVDMFIYASSANVYGAPLQLPVTEQTPFNPRLPYDYSKVLSEKMVRSYQLHKGLRAVITRTWLLFGEGEPESRAVQRFVKSCLKNDKIPLYNSGRDVTDPTYVSNYCRAVELILSNDKAAGEAFNVGSGSRMSVREMAEKIKEITGSKSELQLLPPRTELEKEPQISYPSLKKIEELLGYKPVVSFEEGIRKVVEYYLRAQKA